MEEEWRNVVGYEGLYQVSNLGKVRSLDRVDNRGKLRKGKMMGFAITKQGFVKVGLSKDGAVRKRLVHRIVAEAFIPNPNKCSVIRHIDYNPCNNKVKNLEWCIAKNNTNHRTTPQRISKRSSKVVFQGNKEFTWNKRLDNAVLLLNTLELSDKIKKDNGCYIEWERDCDMLIVDKLINYLSDVFNSNTKTLWSQKDEDIFNYQQKTINSLRKKYSLPI